MPGKYRNQKPNRGGALLVGVLAAILVVLIGVAFWISGLEPPQNLESSASTQQSTASQSTQPSTTITTQSTAPTEPPVVKVSTATIANTGDMLMHMRVVYSADVDENGNYDFAHDFAYFKDYVSRADYAVTNLETTLAGTSYAYTGYPTFNCPDGIASSLQDAGFDMLLTANNHTYDTNTIGFHRTQQVLQGLGMDYLGTIPDESQPLWQVKDINGIQIGMVCYTYQTGNLDRVALNGIPMNDHDQRLIGAFSYHHLDVFYEEMQANIEAMKAAGAEAVVLYIHWGNEYYLVQNSYQDQIAQAMCDLGVDVIVGGHPHVVQPMALLTSTTDPEQKTVCLYSMGNAISNQRVEHMEGWPDTEHTEDGVLFSFTFAKYSDGTVILESVELLPLWVNFYYNQERGKESYQILPLDLNIEDWKTQFRLNDEMYQETQESYQRTMEIVGAGLQDIQAYIAQLVADTEEKLEVKQE